MKFIPFIRLLACLLLAGGPQVFVHSMAGGASDISTEQVGPVPFGISAESLLMNRVFARDLVISVPGIDLVRQASPRFIRADDPAFSARDHYDGDWSVMDSLRRDTKFDRDVVYWVRFTVVLPVGATKPGEPLGTGVDLHIFTQGAMEVFLNGELMERIGVLPAYGAVQGYEAGKFIPRRRVRLHFLADGRPESIAVRYVHEPVITRDTGGTDALLLALTTPEETVRMERMEQSTLLQYGLFQGVNLIIMLLALVIVSRGRRDRSWELLGVFSFLMGLVAFTNITPKVSAGLSLGMMDAVNGLNLVVYPLSIFFLVLVMRDLFATLDLRSVLVFGSLALAMVGASVFTYLSPEPQGKFDGWFTLVFFMEVAHQAVRAVNKQVHGGWLIAAGALVFIVNGVLIEQFFQFISMEMPRGLRTFMRVSLYLTMPITIAAYLALRAVYNNRMLARQRDELDLEVNERTAELRLEKERSDALLLNILPEEVAEELKMKGEADARSIDHVTVLFTDFKGFTAMSERLTARELVADIHESFSAFDHIMEKHGIEKIKTIGDAYMAAGGLPTPNTTHAVDVVQAALEVQAFIAEGKARKVAQGKPYFEIRIGIHTGPVVAGIVGVKKFQYDIWGDTVNIASRMESSGEAGKVNISEATFELVRNEPGFICTPRGKVHAKGKGEMKMYFVGRSLGEGP